VGSLGKAGKDALLYLPGRLVVGCVGFVVLPVLTHLFPDPADIGRYDLTLRFAQFLHFLFTAWLGTALVRYYADYSSENRASTFYTVIVWWRRAGVLAGFLVAIGVYFWGPDSLFETFRDLILLGGLVFVSLAVFETDQMLLRAKGLAAMFSVYLIITTVGKFILGFALVLLFHRGIGAILWGTAVVPYLVHVIWSRGQYGYHTVFPKRNDYPFLKEFFFFGLPIALSGLLRFSLSNADRFFLRWLTGTDEQVGMFAVGNLFGDQPISLLSSTLMLAAYPEISRIYDQQSREQSEQFLAQVTRIFLIVSLPLTALTIAGAPFVFRLIISGKTSEAWDVVPFIAAATFVLGLANYGSLGLYMGKRSDLMLWCTAASLIVNMVFNVAVIPSLGYIGCGGARFAANLIFLLAVSFGSRRFLAWHFPWKTLLRTGIAAAVSAGGIYFVAQYSLEGATLVPGMTLLGFLALCAFGVYGLILFLTREIEKQHVVAALRLFGRSSS